MANKREFKKEISLILELVYEECLFTREFNPEKADKVDELIDTAIEYFTLTISAKNIEKNLPFKSFYSSLKESYYAKMLEILSKLEELRK